MFKHATAVRLALLAGADAGKRKASNMWYLHKKHAVLVTFGILLSSLAKAALLAPVMVFSTPCS